MELTIVAGALVLFLLLAAVELPVGVALCLSGAIAIGLLDGPAAAATVIANAPYQATAKYVLFVIPMYVLLGSVVANAGIGMRIYRAANRFIGWLPGGLPASAVAATALFSGISGSSSADVATFGRVSVDEMSRNGYQRDYAAAVVAAAGTFAVLIPPNVALVIYGVLADESVGELILAALVPGVLSVTACVAFVVLKGMRAQRAEAQPYTAVRSEARQPQLPSVTSSSTGAARAGASAAVVVGEQRLASVATPGAATLRGDLVGVFYAVLLFLVVVGGLYGGAFTATEAGAVGALVALIIGMLVRRDDGTSLRTVASRSLQETADIASMVFLLLVGGAVFSYLVTTSGVTASLARSIAELDVPSGLVIVIILALLLVSGMFLDGLSLMLIAIPIVAPVVTGLGYEGVWFAILALKAIEVGLITPPVGLNVFVVSGATKVPAEGIFRQLVPFVLLDLAVLAVLFTFPSFVTWLPRLAGY